MRLPRVGVTCSTATITEETGHTATVDAMFVELGEVLSRCGTVPFLIPLGVPIENVGEYLKSLDAVVLTGGPDVGKVSNDTIAPLKGGLDVRKDRLEWHLCSLALSCGIPLLGICRGLQLVNVYLGGALCEDLGSEYPSAVVHATSPDQPAAEHEITIAQASKMSSIFDGPCGRVNSYHHQAIKRLAPALKATAWAPDGIIEGIESVIYRSLLAVQFHPEIDYERDESSTRVFQWLAEEARQFLIQKEGNGQGLCWEEMVG